MKPNDVEISPANSLIFSKTTRERSPSHQNLKATLTDSGFMSKEQITVGYPLINFEPQVEEIPISRQIMIKKVTIVSKPIEILDLKLGEIEFTHWCASIKGNSFDAIRQNAIALIYGLRLFKTGPVGIEEGYIESELSPPDLPKEKIPQLWFLKPDLEVLGTYTLEKNEAHNLQRFFDKFLRVGTIKRPLSTAFGRFNKGIQSDSVEEAFIDFITTLEILFLRNMSGEIRYKLANRVACLIGDEENSHEICNDVKELYKLRSKTLHSGRVDYEKLRQKLHQLESLVRKSLLSVLALKDRLSHKNLPSKLDECLHKRETKIILRNYVNEFWKDIVFPELSSAK